MAHKLDPEKDVLLEEYKIGNELSQAYFKGSWTVVSILFPICFGLVAVSYYPREMLELTSQKLLPLAGASVFLYFYAWFHGWRYTGFNRSIWNRLREIEGEKGMDLHGRVDKDDRARPVRWSLVHLNFFLLVFLLLLWAIRLYYAPLVQPDPL